MMTRLALGAATVAIALLAGPADAQERTFRYAFQGDLKVLDQYTLNETFSLGTLGNVYEGLVKRDGELEIVPGLATAWEMVDPLTWRFTLRQGVKFHNGNPFNAADVVFSANRVRSAGSDLKTRIPAAAAFSAIDDHTVEVRLETPDPALIGEWDTWGMMDREWAEENDAVAVTAASDTGANFAALNANGTGPFRVVSHEVGVRTVFEANRDWWGWDDRQFNIDRVDFTPIASDATRVAALLSGEMDMIEPVPLQDIARVDANPTTRVMTGPELRTIFLGFDQMRDELIGSSVIGRNPFRDARVRRAVYHAIDEDAITQKIMRGLATPAALLISPDLFDRSAEFARLPHDPEGARTLLAEAGYPDGFTIVMDCPNDRYVNDEQICQAIAAMLARIGITVNLNAVPKSQFFAKVLASNRFDTSFYLLGWTPSGFDSWNVLNNLLICRNEDGTVGSPFNLGGYCNPQVDALTAKIQVETDKTRRDDMIAQAFRITTDEVASIPLHQQSLSWGVSRNVELVQRADDILMFDHIRKN